MTSSSWRYGICVSFVIARFVSLRRKTHLPPVEFTGFRFITVE